MAIATKLDIDTSVTAEGLANQIFGPGMQLVSAEFQGDPVAAGIYSGAEATMPGVAPADSGVILSTGRAESFTNGSGTSDTNLQGNTSTNTAGVDDDPMLNAAAGMRTYDAAILNASFIPDGHYITMRFVFASEEYPEYVHQNVNDTFAVWVNGQEVEMKISQGRDLSVDNVNQSANPNLYNDNTQDQFNTEMDGFTAVISFKAKVVPGEVNTIKIAIADGGDAIYDSNVLIAADSLQVVTLAMDDAVQMAPGESKIVDVLANDHDFGESGLKVIEVMGQKIAPGQSITLSTGEVITLNADGTLTVTADQDLGTNVITYTIEDGTGAIDIGYLEIKTVLNLTPDGVVSGSAAGDLIDSSYSGDPEGDLVDHSDAKGVLGSQGDDDVIEAGAGNDTVHAGAGHDITYLGDGDDLYEDDPAGNDTIYGGAGNDTVFAGEGDDLIHGGADDDVLRGEAGADSLHGGSGADLLDGGAGDDQLFGGAGADTVIGGAGADLLVGGADADVIYGGPGDTVDGGEEGDDIDTLIVDNVQEILYGGGNNESGTINFLDGSTLGFTNIELIIADGIWHHASPNGIVSGTDGDDIIDENYTGDPEGEMVDNGDAIAPGAGPNDDLIHGLDGNDLIRAGEGNDKVFGGNDNDTIEGGNGNDTLLGEGGEDLLYGGAGDDELFGGAGNDTLYGGSGKDTLSGDDDRDTFIVRHGEGIGTLIDGGEGGDDWDTLDLSDWPRSQITITYDPVNPENGTVQFFDENGDPLGKLDFVNIETVIKPPPCFTPGTLIATERGEVAVEDLAVGDLVLTRDNGYQPIRWIGRRGFGAAEVAAQPELAPIEIKAGALGAKVPARDMRVSPQHRMLLTGAASELLFGEHEVLAAALHLTHRPGIRQLAGEPVEYLHLLFDAHEIICSDGAWSESYQPGLQTFDAMTAPQREEILKIFPELEDGQIYPAARMTLKRHEVALLAA